MNPQRGPPLEMLGSKHCLARCFLGLQFLYTMGSHSGSFHSKPGLLSQPHSLASELPSLLGHPPQPSPESFWRQPAQNSCSPTRWGPRPSEAPSQGHDPLLTALSPPCTPALSSNSDMPQERTRLEAIHLRNSAAAEEHDFETSLGVGEHHLTSFFSGQKDVSSRACNSTWRTQSPTIVSSII